MLALTRDISSAIGSCQLTHQTRELIDLPLACAQHEEYERALRSLGCDVRRLTADETMPDSVFIEDIAVVFAEVAIITRPGAESRRGETTAVAQALGVYRPLVSIEPPGTLDGGDVLVAGTRVFVGESPRTNAAAVSQMDRLLAPRGYTVQTVPVHGCLHLKSAVTAVSEDTLLINPDWAPADRFRSFQLLDVHPAEPYGANGLLIGHTVIYPTAFPRTRARLDARKVRVADVDVSELAKAEGAVTCCSLIFDG